MYIEFGQQDNGIDVEVVELDRGYGVDGQVFTDEQDTSCIMLNDELQSDPIANAMLYNDISLEGVTEYLKTRAQTATMVVDILSAFNMQAELSTFIDQAYAV